MSHRSPIYSLLHKELKACVDHLFEVSQHPQFCPKTNGHHLVARLSELQQFSHKIRSDNHYHPLSDFKHYLENTMVSFLDQSQNIQSIRLSEALFLLGRPDEESHSFDPVIKGSLLTHCIQHIQKEIQPGSRFYTTLQEIKML